MVDLIPYLVSAYMKTQSSLAPAALLSRAVEGYGSKGREIANQEALLSTALRGVKELDLRREGSGFAFGADKGLLLGIAGTYLAKAYIREGSHGAPFVLDPAGTSPHLDAVMTLPMQSVYVLLREDHLDSDSEADLLEMAVKLAPSQLWVLTLEDSNVDSRLNPVFRSENRILFGRLRIIGIGRVIESHLGGAYEVEVKREGERFSVKATPR